MTSILKNSLVTISLLLSYGRYRTQNLYSRYNFTSSVWFETYIITTQVSSLDSVSILISVGGYQPSTSLPKPIPEIIPLRRFFCLHRILFEILERVNVCSILCSSVMSSNFTLTVFSSSFWSLLHHVTVGFFLFNSSSLTVEEFEKLWRSNRWVYLPVIVTKIRII